MTITAVARAKINLTLDILGQRPDGYHEVEMVMQSIELHDSIEFTSAGRGIILAVEGADLDPGPDNLVCRAAELLRRRGKIKSGVKIRLVKAIPVAAGLGGGSANAAAALKGLNELWETRLSLSELMSLGAQLGSDVPFCLLNGTALATGRGEQLEQLPPCPRLGLVLVKPQLSVSTASVYRAYTPGPGVNRPDNRAMISAIRDKDISSIAQNLANALESVTTRMHPEIERVKAKLIQAGALGVLMSGSGPTVFGLAADQETARAIADRYKSAGEEVFVTATVDG
ncbi:MAG: 4-(cytidine 5'-diphospho)-2-C-methyl-D-erythritol kinase [Desulfotomaculaceae bacterium]|nr:4-(cytidine 5'-diphospho)-2-C-methyl-D-erythritol kinase [Desulfotomaculaceae bacterium]MDD4766591.1 4-(cytidine 5'-diphospho)-2-C-methyl-D-erythritol kinase [Desulfotomaculaceae bacterium]